MKRSTQVALLLMGVTGVGATGYMMTRPPKDCIPHGTPAAQIAAGARDQEMCPPRRSWSSSSGGYSSSWTRTHRSTSAGSLWPIFSRGTATTSSTSVPLASRSTSMTTTSRSSTTTRSGFGSSGRSYSSSS